MDDLINEIIPNKKELSEEEEKQNSIKEEKKPKNQSQVLKKEQI